MKNMLSTLRQFARDMHAVSKRIYRAYHATAKPQTDERYLNFDERVMVINYLKNHVKSMRELQQDLRNLKAYHAPVVWVIEEDTALCLKQ